jgi:thiamine transport system permease protein
MPPVVLGAGWFVLLLWVPGGIDFGFGVVIVINALMAIPFVTRVLGPAIGESRARHDRLCASLGIAGLARLRLIDWPVLRRPLSVALAFALALSLGDLGAIALFGSEHLVTLPLLLYQRLGSYRVNDAAGLALFLGALCLAIMTLAERAARRDSGL